MKLDLVPPIARGQLKAQLFHGGTNRCGCMPPPSTDFLILALPCDRRSHVPAHRNI